MHLCIYRSPSRLVRVSTSMAVTGRSTEYTTASYDVCATIMCLAGTTFRGCLDLSRATCAYIRAHGGLVL
jgi:hypothetical protein